MKLRIKDNSIRLRLNQIEVHQMHEKGKVQCAMKLPLPLETQLAYTLESEAVESLKVLLEDHTLRVIVPTAIIRNWCLTDQVGFDEQLPLAEGGFLNVLVEKDFQCLNERPMEDESNQFPNPAASPK